jgi:hypothetical protein
MFGVGRHFAKVPEGDIKNPMLRQCAVINPIDAAPKISAEESLRYS